MPLALSLVVALHRYFAHRKLFSEPGKQDNCATDPFEVSDAETMLNYLRGRSERTSRAA